MMMNNKHADTMIFITNVIVKALCSSVSFAEAEFSELVVFREIFVTERLFNIRESVSHREEADVSPSEEGGVNSATLFIEIFYPGMSL